jgi:hypothetical protein
LLCDRLTAFSETIRMMAKSGLEDIPNKAGVPEVTAPLGVRKSGKDSEVGSCFGGHRVV